MMHRKRDEARRIAANIAKLPECSLPWGCCRYGTVKGKARGYPCVHRISPKGLPCGETIQGEWGIWSPGGRPAGAASFPFGGQSSSRVASVAAFTTCHSGAASLAGNACTQLANLFQAAIASALSSAGHLL